MPKNLLDRALKSVEENDYQVTNVRGYNPEAVEYVSESAKMIGARYKPETVIAVNGNTRKVVAHGRTMEGVLSAVGGLEQIQFPNSEHIMVGKVKDILLAGRRFDKHVAHLGKLHDAYPHHTVSHYPF